MKLKNEFADFNEAIRIKSETNALMEKRQMLEEDIKSKLPIILETHDIHISASDIRMIDQGSYKYHTTIKDVIVDRDVAVIFPLDIFQNDDPRLLKGYLQDAIQIHSRTITVKEPCVRVSYFDDGEEWLHIDLPLYVQYEDKVYLARGKINSDIYSWEEADPDKLNDFINEKLNGNGQLRRIIRFIKKWKNEKYAGSSGDHEVPPSIGLTLLACDCFVPASTGEGEDDLLSFQQTMQNMQDKFALYEEPIVGITFASLDCNLPVVPYTDVFEKMKKSSTSYMVTFYKRLSNAVDSLTNAINVESAHDAGKYVQKVLGAEFSVPAKEAVVATTQNRRNHSFGLSNDS